MPKVSIIIPTRNRAHLLKLALKSAVEQDYQDLEIVVCDNYSADNTKEIVASFDNKNIIYLRTDKALSMPDNWEFALSKANGEYITFLTDASYLLPNSISIAIEELNKFNEKLAVWKNCSYVHSDWIESERRNTLYIPKVTYRSYLLNSKTILKNCFTNIRAHAPLMPRSINSLCHRSIIKKVLNVQGRFFLPSAPDFSSGASMLLNTEEYVLIDKPLFIGSVSSVNIGANQSFHFGKAIQDFYKEFDNKLSDIAFLEILTTPTCIAKSFENVRSFYLDSCPELNMKNLLCETVDSLSKMEIYETKADIGNYWQILNKYIAVQSKDIKLATAKQKVLSKLKWKVIKMVRSSPFLYWLEFLRNVQILKGSKFKFSNIEEAAKIVEEINNSQNLNKK